MWFWKIWLLVKCKVKRWVLRYFPPTAKKVSCQMLPSGYRLVTFEFAGNKYRGHLEPGRSLLHQPWLRGARKTMKRPCFALDASGRNVTGLVREYWGPCGDWNGGLRLQLHLPSEPGIQSPVRVRFNDGDTMSL